MKQWKKALITMTALIMLSACGGNDADQNQNHNENDANRNQNDVQNEFPNDHEQNESNENDAIDSADPEDAENEDVKPEEPAVVEVQYKMNGIYDIVPLDDSVNRNVVLLTFDDGPKDEDMVNALLDILDKHDAKAIFFVNGFRVEQNPELLKLIDERGHTIGNHSWDHVILRDLSKDEVDQQLGDVQDIVEQLIGKRPQFFRPPNGVGSDLVREKVSSEGMLFMNWSNGSEDWVYREPEKIIQNVMDQLRPGSNILMHELQWTVEALDTLLTKISEEGYEFVHPEAIQITD